MSSFKLLFFITWWLSTTELIDLNGIQEFLNEQELPPLFDKQRRSIDRETIKMDQLSVSEIQEYLNDQELQASLDKHIKMDKPYIIGYKNSQQIEQLVTRIKSCEKFVISRDEQRVMKNYNASSVYVSEVSQWIAIQKFPMWCKTHSRSTFLDGYPDTKDFQTYICNLCHAPMGNPTSVASHYLDSHPLELVDVRAVGEATNQGFQAQSGRAPPAGGPPGAPTQAPQGTAPTMTSTTNVAGGYSPSSNLQSNMAQTNENISVAQTFDRGNLVSTQDALSLNAPVKCLREATIPPGLTQIGGRTLDYKDKAMTKQLVSDFTIDPQVVPSSSFIQKIELYKTVGASLDNWIRQHRLVEGPVIVTLVITSSASYQGKLLITDVEAGPLDRTFTFDDLYTRGHEIVTLQGDTTVSYRLEDSRMNIDPRRVADLDTAELPFLGISLITPLRNPFDGSTNEANVKIYVEPAPGFVCVNPVDMGYSMPIDEEDHEFTLTPPVGTALTMYFDGVHGEKVRNGVDDFSVQTSDTYLGFRNAAVKMAFSPARTDVEPAPVKWYEMSGIARQYNQDDMTTSDIFFQLGNINHDEANITSTTFMSKNGDCVYHKDYNWPEGLPQFDSGCSSTLLPPVYENTGSVYFQLGGSRNVSLSGFIHNTPTGQLTNDGFIHPMCVDWTANRIVGSDNPALHSEMRALQFSLRRIPNVSSDIINNDPTTFTDFNFNDNNLPKLEENSIWSVSSGGTDFGQAVYRHNHFWIKPITGGKYMKYVTGQPIKFVRSSATYTPGTLPLDFVDSLFSNRIVNLRDWRYIQRAQLRTTKVTRQSGVLPGVFSGLGGMMSGIASVTTTQMQNKWAAEQNELNRTNAVKLANIQADAASSIQKQKGEQEMRAMGYVASQNDAGNVVNGAPEPNGNGQPKPAGTDQSAEANQSADTNVQQQRDQIAEDSKASGQQSQEDIITKL